MSETFTRDSDGKKWREVGRTFPNDNVIIEPIPAPLQTETEILIEMHSAIQGVPWPDQYEKNRMLRLADTVVAACGKLRGLKGK